VTFLVPTTHDTWPYTVGQMDCIHAIQWFWHVSYSLHNATSGAILLSFWWTFKLYFFKQWRTILFTCLLPLHRQHANARCMLLNVLNILAERPMRWCGAYQAPFRRCVQTDSSTWTFCATSRRFSAVQRNSKVHLSLFVSFSYIWAFYCHITWI